MKRFFCLLCALALLLTMTACGAASSTFYESPKDATIASLLDRTRPQTMLSYLGGFTVELRNDQAGCTTKMSYLFDGTNTQVNQFADYDNGDYSHIYFTTDPSDPYLYTDATAGATTDPFSTAEISSHLSESMLGLDYYTCEITSSSKSGSDFLITYDAFLDDALAQKVKLTVNPKAGLVSRADVEFITDGKAAGTATLVFSYGRKVDIDLSPKEKAPAPEVSVKPEDDTEEDTAAFSFAATDLNGNLLTEADLADAKLIMVNFWASWCEPCISEMPQLQQLYETYARKGLVILGVYESDDTEEDVRAVVSDNGITYPIVCCDSQLSAYKTDYIPTTIFVDGTGAIVSDEPYVGAKTYNEWEDLVTSYLG